MEQNCTKTYDNIITAQESHAFVCVFGIQKRLLFELMFIKFM